MWGGKQLYAFLGGDTIGASKVITGAATIFTWTIPFRCIPLRCGFTVTTAVTTWASTISFTVVGGTVAAGGATTTVGGCGTLTVPVSTEGVGKAYYENTDYVAAGTGAWVASLDEGDQVQVNVTIPLGAPGAGAGVPWLLVEINPEQPANNLSMISG